jgi:hypothetical protein
MFISSAFMNAYRKHHKKMPSWLIDHVSFKKAMDVARKGWPYTCCPNPPAKRVEITVDLEREIEAEVLSNYRDRFEGKFEPIILTAATPLHLWLRMSGFGRALGLYPNIEEERWGRYRYAVKGTQPYLQEYDTENLPEDYERQARLFIKYMGEIHNAVEYLRYLWFKVVIGRTEPILTPYADIVSAYKERDELEAVLAEDMYQLYHKAMIS